MLVRNLGIIPNRQICSLPFGRIALAIAVAIAAWNAPSIAHAQQAEAKSSLDEVVVTAQRREQNLQDVPISVAVFSQERMDAQGLREIADIAKFTPGLTFSKSDGLRSVNTSISIRGVTSSIGAPTTGIYVNDTPIAVQNLTASGGSNSTAYPHLFDLARVEVLRGPQGTLYGAGSEGGTVRFISPQPSLTDSSLYLRAGASTIKYGSPGYEFGVAGGAPIITNKLGFRISASTSLTGGYIDHGDYYTGKVDQADYNWDKTWSIRAALKWAPTDRLTISPSIFHQARRTNGLDSFYLPDDVPNQRLNLKPGDDGYIDTSPGSYYAKHHDGWANYGHFGEGVGSGHYVSADRVISHANVDMDLYAVDFQYSLPKIDLTYNASVYRNRLHALSDFSGVVFAPWSQILGDEWIYFPSNPELVAPAYGNNDNYAFVQEFRVQNSNADSRFQWVAGAYDQQQNMAVNNFELIPNWGQIFQEAITPPPCNSAASCNAWAADQGLGMREGKYPVWVENAADYDEKAIFGQVDIHATKHLTATVGVRNSSMYYYNHSLKAGIYYSPEGTHINSESTTHATTPRFGLKWTTDGGNMFYLSRAKGTRSGGGNPPVNNSPVCAERLKSAWNLDAPPELYKPDSVWSNELGTKFRVLDDKLTVNADVFRINWDDMIRRISVGGNCILSFITNLGTAHSDGAELAVQYRPVDALTLSMTTGYAKVQSGETIPVPDATDPTKPKLDSQGRPVLITRKGAILPGSHTTASFAVQYSFSALDKPSYFRVDYHYSGTPSKGDRWDPQSSQYAGAFDLFETPTVKTTNARIGTRVDDWDVSFYIDNLTNEQPIFKFRQQDAVAWMSGSTIQPRTMGFTAVLRY